MQSQFKNFEDYLKYYHELKVNKSQPPTATTTVWAFGLLENGSVFERFGKSENRA
jgi:hypothetical protein